MPTEILGLDEMIVSQGKKFLTHNTANRQAAGRTVRVLDRDGGVVATTAAADGDVYIVDSTTGDWSGAVIGDLAHKFGGAYSFYTPLEGYRVWVNDEDLEVVWNSSEWVDVVQHADTQVLSNASTAVAWDMTLGRYAELTLASTVGHTLSNPSSVAKGGKYTLKVTQAAGGSLTLDYGSEYKWPGGTDPIISVAASAIDVLNFDHDGADMLGTFAQAMST